eukprot:15592873-Heterocapsa_arctica.AAC.1
MGLCKRWETTSLFGVHTLEAMLNSLQAVGRRVPGFDRRHPSWNQANWPQGTTGPTGQGIRWPLTRKMETHSRSPQA